MRDQFTEYLKMLPRSLTDSLSRGSESLSPWMSKLRDLINRSYINRYVLARAGRNAMTKSDWSKVGRRLQTRYSHLQEIAEDSAEGKLSARQTGARAEW